MLIQKFNPLAEENFDLVQAPIAQTIIVAKTGGDYTEISDALAAISDATSVKQYLLRVYPGTYAPFAGKAFCHIFAVSGTVTVVGNNATALTGTIASGESQNIGGLNFVNYATQDDSKTVEITGDINFDLCNFYLVPMGDYSGVCVKTSSDTLQIMGRCSTVVQPFGGLETTKNLDGLRANGAGTLSVYQSSVQIAVNASSGDTCCIDENGTGERNYNNCLLYYRNINASYSGIARGFCVSSASAGQRLSQATQVRLQGAGSGTAYAFALDSTTNNAEYFHSNSVVVVNGFATEGVAFTGAGDIQRVWLSSPTKDLHKFGPGLSVVTPLDKNETGFVEWGPEATYWSYDTGTGTFTVDKSGAGCVHGAPMTWAGGQSVVLTDRAVNYVYYNSEGTIGVATSGVGLYSENVVVFEVWRQGTNYIVAKENHPYEFTTAVAGAWHRLFGTLLSDATQTLAINSGANRTINLVGTNTLTDHGLDTVISAQTPVTWRQMVEGVSGAMAQIANAQGIVSKKSNGTDTGVNVSNGRYVVYRLGVTKESLNSSTPTFICVADDTDSANLSGANTRITSGVVRPFPAEAKALEIAQEGFAIVQADGAGAGTLVQVTTALQVFGAQFVSGGTSSSASLITTDTTGFTGELSGAETNVQSALARLDAFDSTLDWATAKAYRVGNIVKVSAEGYEGSWRCISAHTSGTWSTDFNSNYWELLSSWMGPREVISQPSASFFSAGQSAAINSSTGAWIKANGGDAVTSEMKGIISAATASYAVLSKTGSKVSFAAAPYTAGGVYFMSDSVDGAITETEPSTVGNIRLFCGQAKSTTVLHVLLGQAVVVGGANLYTDIVLSNGATTTLQNVSGATFPAGSGGYIEGFIRIDATTDYVFTFKQEFSKPITGTAYGHSVSLGAGDIPTDTVFSMTTGGLMQITLPSITGFSSAVATFCMQAAAVGTKLPLQIDGSNVTGPTLGSTTGAAIEEGRIGQKVNFTWLSPSIGTAGATTNIYSITLPVGIWIVYGAVGLSTGTGTAGSDNYFGLSITETSMTMDGSSTVYTNLPAGVGSRVGTTTRMINQTSETTIYIVGRHGLTTLGTAAWSNSYFKPFAVRIA